jgi:hypothetical protein
VCTSGANVGVSRTIKNGTGTGVIGVIAPWPFPVAIGDTFDFYPGCDKDGHLHTKFSNLVHFAAEPFVPLPDMIV